MIEANHLTKRYGVITAISDISFKVEKGDVLGFLGPNGSGKTTTMRILTCYMPATEGTAKVAGFDVFDHSLEVKRRIGYLPENPPLYSEMTVKDYLDFISRIKGISRSDKKKTTDRVLEKCGLEEVYKRLIGNLSKGYRQRVGLAQALIHNPEVLILDEPTIGLDPIQVVEIRNLIKELGKEHTIIISTHILPEVTMVCNKVVIIHEGRIMAEDTEQGLSFKLRKSEKIMLMVKKSVNDICTHLSSLPGMINVFKDERNENSFVLETRLGADIREDIARMVIEKGWGLIELKSLQMSLEEVFLKLTMEEIP